MTPRRTRDHINKLVRHLVEVGLVDDQKFAIQRPGTTEEVTFDNASCIAKALRNTSYEKVYELFAKERVFNLKLLDGALVQMQYLFDRKDLLKHRLAYLPSPHLERYERDPKVYEEEQTYAEIVERRVIAVPLRFDFDSDNRKHVKVDHPKSHLTIGEYRQCRIPVTSPLTPHCFIRFLLKHFYRTDDKDFTTALPHLPGTFSQTIHPAEQKWVHLVVV